VVLCSLVDGFKHLPLPGHKAVGPWGWPLTSTSAMVKNKWSCSCTPPTCLQDVSRDKFTVYIYLWVSLRSGKTCINLWLVWLLTLPLLLTLP
jgi:hypothetical protein